VRKTTCSTCGSEVFDTEQICPSCGGVLAHRQETAHNAKAVASQQLPAWTVIVPSGLLVVVIVLLLASRSRPPDPTPPVVERRQKTETPTQIPAKVVPPNLPTTQLPGNAPANPSQGGGASDLLVGEWREQMSSSDWDWTLVFRNVNGQLGGDYIQHHCCPN